MIKLFFYSHLVSLALAWGGEGHRLITSLAIKQMKSRHRDFLLNPLGDLMKASTWADTDEAEAWYPLSGADHFSNTPYRACADFDMARDCGAGKTKDRCIVTGLARAISVAIDLEVPESNRTDSLKFILHLMADIHQPLHTGFREDAGGLGIFLREPAGMDLHGVWDTKVIDELGASMRSTDLISDLQKKLELRNQSFAQRIRSQVNFTDVLSSLSLMTAYAADIASDTVQFATCRSAYVHVGREWIENGDSLSSDYFKSRIPIVVVQILKASVRLGYLLDAIADTLYMRMKEERRLARISKGLESAEKMTEDDTNFFSSLSVMEGEGSEDIVIPTVAKKKVAPSRTDRREREIMEHRLLDEHSALMESERASYTFNGIDLSDVTVVPILGAAKIITTKSRLAMKLKEDYLTSVFPYTISEGEKITRGSLELDQAVFPEDADDDLLIRLYLKLNGFDPRIDIEEYRDRIRFRRNPIREPSFLLDGLITAHNERSKRASGISVKKQIRKNKGQILHFNIDFGFGKVSLFILRETLLKRSKGLSPSRTRFNLYMMTLSGYDTSVYVDPLIVDTSLYSVMTDSGNYNFLVQYAKYPGSRIGGLDSLIEEISEVERAHRDRMEGNTVPYEIGGKNVEWFFDYPGDESNTYSVFEWFAKGITKTKIMTELGIDRVTYTSDVEIPITNIPETWVVNMNKKIEQFKSGPFEYKTDGVLDRIESNKIFRFKVGHVRAFYMQSNQSWDRRLMSCIKVSQLSVGDESTTKVVYLLDTLIFTNSSVPLTDIHRVISGLESKVAGNWTSNFLERASFMFELQTIHDILLSPKDIGNLLDSSKDPPINRIGDIKSSESEYTFLVWIRTPGFIVYTVNPIIQPFRMSDHDRAKIQNISETLLQNGLRNCGSTIDPVNSVLQMAQRWPFYILVSGNVRAYFLERPEVRHPSFEMAYKIFRREVNRYGSGSLDPVVYLFDYLLFNNITVPPPLMDGLISKLDQLPTAIRGGTEFPQRPTLYSEITAIDYLTRNQRPENITTNFLAPLKAYGEFLPGKDSYGLLFWLRNVSSSST